MLAPALFTIFLLLIKAAGDCTVSENIVDMNSRWFGIRFSPAARGDFEQGLVMDSGEMIDYSCTNDDYIPVWRFIKSLKLYCKSNSIVVRNRMGDGGFLTYRIPKCIPDNCFIPERIKDFLVDTDAPEDFGEIDVGVIVETKCNDAAKEIYFDDKLSQTLPYMCMQGIFSFGNVTESKINQKALCVTPKCVIDQEILSKILDGVNPSVNLAVGDELSHAESLTLSCSDANKKLFHEGIYISDKLLCSDGDLFVVVNDSVSNKLTGSIRCIAESCTLNDVERNKFSELNVAETGKSMGTGSIFTWSQNGEIPGGVAFEVLCGDENKEVYNAMEISRSKNIFCGDGQLVIADSLESAYENDASGEFSCVAPICMVLSEHLHKFGENVVFSNNDFTPFTPLNHYWTALLSCSDSQNGIYNKGVLYEVFQLKCVSGNFYYGSAENLHQLGEGDIIECLRKKCVVTQSVFDLLPSNAAVSGTSQNFEVNAELEGFDAGEIRCLDLSKKVLMEGKNFDSVQIQCSDGRFSISSDNVKWEDFSAKIECVTPECDISSSLDYFATNSLVYNEDMQLMTNENNMLKHLEKAVVTCSSEEKEVYFDGVFSAKNILQCNDGGILIKPELSKTEHYKPLASPVECIIPTCKVACDVLDKIGEGAMMGASLPVPHKWRSSVSCSSAGNYIYFENAFLDKLEISCDSGEFSVIPNENSNEAKVLNTFISCSVKTCSVTSDVLSFISENVKVENGVNGEFKENLLLNQDESVNLECKDPNEKISNSKIFCSLGTLKIGYETTNSKPISERVECFSFCLPDAKFFENFVNVQLLRSNGALFSSGDSLENMETLSIACSGEKSILTINGYILSVSNPSLACAYGFIQLGKQFSYEHELGSKFECVEGCVLTDIVLSGIKRDKKCNHKSEVIDFEEIITVGCKEETSFMQNLPTENSLAEIQCREGAYFYDEKELTTPITCLPGCEEKNLVITFLTERLDLKTVANGTEIILEIAPEWAENKTVSAVCSYGIWLYLVGGKLCEECLLSHSVSIESGVYVITTALLLLL